ncbi:MAG TPA: hypothetical protein VGH87_17640 [Polyangiaceae bacterium]|nr:hypothetical protein [Polyangiaceae bacterium]
MKVTRERLSEIVDAGKATKDEVHAMAEELLAIREDEAKRDDGTTPVHLEHVGAPTVSGWFAPRRGRMLRSQMHVGARFSLAGRVYGVVSIEGDHVRVR